MSDVVLYPIADNPSPLVVDGIVFTPTPGPLSYTDIVHVSHGVGVTIQNCTIPGGSEDCVDLNNNCENILVQNCHFHPNGEYGSTIKGGTHDVHYLNVVFDAHGKDVDIDLGNWSDQNTVDKTTKVTLENVTAADGKPVVVRVLYADRPTVIGGNVQVKVIWPWVVWLLRKFHKLAAYIP